MRSRGPVEFRIFIDHIDNQHGLVWALTYRKRYFVLKSIWCQVPVHTVYAGRQQPRAFLTGIGRVEVLNDRAIIHDSHRDS